MPRALAAALLLVPRAAGACAFCFGQADGKSGLLNGFWWGIVVLLVVTMSLVGGIGYAIWTVERGRAARDA